MSQKVDLARTVQVNQREMVKLGIVIVFTALAASFILGVVAAIVLAVLAGAAFEFRPGISRWTRRKWYEFRASEDRDIINPPAAPRAQPAAPAQAPRQRPAPSRPAPARAARPAGPGASASALARSGPMALMGSVMSTPPPLEWQALIVRTAEFEPEDSEDFIDFVKGNAAGVFGKAEALAAFAETCEVRGMDPLIVQACYALADSQAESADAWLAVAGEFLTAYSGILEDAELGRTIPHDARQFFGMGDGPAGQAA